MSPAVPGTAPMSLAHMRRSVIMWISGLALAGASLVLLIALAAPANASPLLDVADSSQSSTGVSTVQQRDKAATSRSAQSRCVSRSVHA